MTIATVVTGCLMLKFERNTAYFPWLAAVEGFPAETEDAVVRPANSTA